MSTLRTLEYRVNQLNETRKFDCAKLELVGEALRKVIDRTPQDFDKAWAIIGEDLLQELYEYGVKIYA